jgi:hypothetical protein
MKKITLIILTTLIYSCSSKKDQITHKWLVNKLNIAGQTLEGDAVAGFYLELKNDETYKIVGMQTEEGKWLVKGDSLFATASNGSISGSLIKEISAEKLILETTSEGTSMQIEYIVSK